MVVMGGMGSMSSMTPLDFTELFGHFRSHGGRRDAGWYPFKLRRMISGIDGCVCRVFTCVLITICSIFWPDLHVVTFAYMSILHIGEVISKNWCVIVRVVTMPKKFNVAKALISPVRQER